jgi:hypothetical protein
MMKFSITFLDGPMPHPAHYVVYRLEGCIEVQMESLTDGELHLVSDAEQLLERLLGYRVHIEEV